MTGSSRANLTESPTCSQCSAFLPSTSIIERILIEHKHGMRYATVKHQPRLPLWVTGSNNGLAQDGTPMSLVVFVNAFGYKWVLVFDENHPNKMRASGARDGVVTTSTSTTLRV
ncbi:hypothetical protein ACHAQE_011202 [Botrytis cinerea]